MGVTQEHKERYHFLDGYRCLAVALVLLAHSIHSSVRSAIDASHIPYLGSLFTGFVTSGLNLFFVLSGMVIIKPYLNRERKFDLKKYAYRRMIRLYPPFFFALLFGALVIWINSTFPTWYNVDGMRLGFSWKETFKEACIVSLDGIYYNVAWWSLNVEIVFYVLVPFILPIFPRAEKITTLRLWTIIGCTAAVVIFLQLFLSIYHPLIYSFKHGVPNVSKFIDYPVCFLMGAFLAVKDFTMKQGVIFMIVGGIVVIASAVIYIPALEMNYYVLVHIGYAIFYAGFVVWGFRSKPFRDFWSHPTIVWFGERSYSLYLVHSSIFYLMSNVVSHFTSGRNAYYGILTRGLNIPLSILACIVLFELVEKKYTHGLVTDKALWPWQAKRSMY